MSLRKQLLAFGLLTLVLPWAGYRFVQEMEATLRSGLERALLASAGTVAAALDDEPRLIEAESGGAAPAPGAADGSAPPDVAATEAAAAVYALPLGEAPRLDGSPLGDWSNTADAGSPLGGGHRYWAGVDGRYLYLYVTAADPDIVYEGPPGDTPYGDRIVLALEPAPGSVRWLVLATRAPGTFRAQLTAPPLFKPGGDYEDRVLAAWQETRDGFAVEARVPLDLVGEAFGLALVDVDRGASGYAVSVSSTWPIDAPRPGPLIYERPELERLVAQFAQAGSRFRVLNRRGWVLADTGSILPAAEKSPAPTNLGDELFRRILRRDDPPYQSLEPRPGRLRGLPVATALGGRRAAAWYGRGPGSGTVVAAAVPIRSGGRVVGAVLLEQASDPILTLTDRALVRLMTFTLLATAIAAAGLLGFATLLSFRVRRLARAAETALGPRGEIEAALPGRGARDELGDLARSFGRLLERLREHTDYLKTLAGKLSHELRTPLAVVSTSLDNLEQEAAPGDAARPYLTRLRQGAERLDALLAAMGEATRMEQAIGDSPPERFDVAAVIESCCKAYADIYPERRFACRLAVARAHAVGSPELTAQLLDKLVDNAVDFSAAGSVIDIELAEAGADWRLGVTNRGPLLPESMRERLFESLVSVRSRDDRRPHLGLGLHIVALIAAFHGGRVDADNLPDGSGVSFGVFYPRARDQAAG